MRTLTITVPRWVLMMLVIIAVAVTSSLATALVIRASEPPHQPPAPTQYQPQFHGSQPQFI